jgi:hypothetical protein
MTRHTMYEIACSSEREREREMIRELLLLLLHIYAVPLRGM